MSRPATPTRKTSSRRHFGHLNESRPKDARSSCGAGDIGQAPHCAHFINTSSTCSGDRSALIFLEPGTALDVPRRAHRHAPEPEDGTSSAFTRRLGLGESSGREKASPATPSRCIGFLQRSICWNAATAWLSACYGCPLRSYGASMDEFLVGETLRLLRRRTELLEIMNGPDADRRIKRWLAERRQVYGTPLQADE